MARTPELPQSRGDFLPLDAHIIRAFENELLANPNKIIDREHFFLNEDTAVLELAVVGAQLLRDPQLNSPDYMFGFTFVRGILRKEAEFKNDILPEISRVQVDAYIGGFLEQERIESLEERVANRKEALSEEESNRELINFLDRIGDYFTEAGKKLGDGFWEGAFDCLDFYTGIAEKIRLSRNLGENN